MRLSATGTARGDWGEPIIGRITRTGVPLSERGDHILLAGARRDVEDASGYAAVVSSDSGEYGDIDAPSVVGLDLDHLEEGDVVRVESRGYVRTLYRKNSPHNALFATDHCNSLCLMCSQPPRDVDETGIIEQHLRLIRLIDPATKELGVTGGEPTLLGEGLIEVLRACKTYLPTTSLHLLSNGRLFCYDAFAKDVADVQHPDLMIGIPLYSDIPAEHDYVVQCRDAFEQTVRGLQNLGRFGVPVEIRVVIHRTTYGRLPQLADFIYRNLTFASQIALMGLEITGYTIPNLDALWVDPVEYQPELEAATLFLAARGMAVSIYNHQLCTVPQRLWPYCRKSISDWKNEYLPACETCSVREGCGGFFTSGVKRRHSAHIRPLAPSSACARDLLSRDGVTLRPGASPNQESRSSLQHSIE